MPSGFSIVNQYLIVRAELEILGEHKVQSIKPNVTRHIYQKDVHIDILYWSEGLPRREDSSTWNLQLYREHSITQSLNYPRILGHRHRYTWARRPLERRPSNIQPQSHRQRARTETSSVNVLSHLSLKCICIFFWRPTQFISTTLSRWQLPWTSHPAGEQ